MPHDSIFNFYIYINLVTCRSIKQNDTFNENISLRYYFAQGAVISSIIEFQQGIFKIPYVKGMQTENNIQIKLLKLWITYFDTGQSAIIYNCL